MKNFTVVFAFFSIFFSASAHEYYFAFGEVEYNSATRKIELSLEISAHDLEFDMKKSGIVLDQHIENELKNAVFKKQLESHLAKGFSIAIDDSPFPLKIIGFDVMPTGLLYVYMESEPVAFNRSIFFKFDLLMESFPDQQNKVTFIRNTKKQTAVFLPSKPTETISL